MKTLTVADAYAIQAELLRQRLARGERVVGLKLGFTSAAKQKQMGIRAPIVGWLTDVMRVPTMGMLSRELLIHPRVEPEIAVILKERLSGMAVTVQDVLRATDVVRAALEIVDSRYEDFRFTLSDVIADNASAAYFVLGEHSLSPATCDLRQETCSLRINGHLVGRASGASVLGDPACAVALAARALAEYGLSLEPGWIVLTGGLMEAAPIARGDVIEARFDHLGTVRLSVC